MSALALAMRPGVISVTNPFSGEEVGHVEDIALEAARVERDRDAFANLVVAEAGKTIRQANKEVLRCVNTLRLSADEARRNAGEVVPFDAWAGSGDHQGWFTRKTLGAIVAITPYNDPLNLVEPFSCTPSNGRRQARHPRRSADARRIRPATGSSARIPRLTPASSIRQD